MARFRSKITTRLSWITALAWIALAACEGGRSPDEPVPCGGPSCEPTQLCMIQASGVDAGAGSGDTFACIEQPPGCSAADCDGDCPPCICQQCALEICELVRLVDRQLSCPGQ